MGFSGSKDPWFLVVNFNSVLGAYETTGNISSLPCDEFQAKIIVCDLMEIETRRVFYTRIGRGRNDIILSRLHMTLCFPLRICLVSGFLCYITKVAFESPSFANFLFDRCFCKFPGFQISAYVGFPFSLSRFGLIVWYSFVLGSGTGVLVWKLKLL